MPLCVSVCYLQLQAVSLHWLIYSFRSVILHLSCTGADPAVTAEILFWAASARHAFLWKKKRRHFLFSVLELCSSALSASPGSFFSLPSSLSDSQDIRRGSCALMSSTDICRYWNRNRLGRFCDSVWPAGQNTQKRAFIYIIYSKIADPHCRCCAASL